MKIVLHAIAKKKTKGFKGFKFGTVIGRFQGDLMPVRVVKSQQRSRERLRAKPVNDLMMHDEKSCKQMR